MIDLYQAKCPQASAEPEHYEALFAYAQKRLDKCVFGEKPACKQCPVHCYQPAKREEMKQIMRWAGPRMLWRHPILTVRHLIDDKRPVPGCQKISSKNEICRRAILSGKYGAYALVAIRMADAFDQCNNARASGGFISS